MDPRSSDPHHGVKDSAVISLLLIFVLAFVLIAPFSSGNDSNNPDVIHSGEFGEGFSWSLGEEGVLVIDGTGMMPDLNWNAPWQIYTNDIRSVIIGEGVQSLSDGLVVGCNSLTEIQISSTVQNVGDLGKYAYPSLLSITVSDDSNYYSSVNGILFDKNSTILIKCPSAKIIESYEVSNSVKDIGDGAFYGCKHLRSITLPDGLQTIGDAAFSGCESLMAIDLPDSLTSLGAQSFYGCSSLRSVVIPDGVTTLDTTFYGCVHLMSITIGRSVQTIEHNPFPVSGRLYEIINLSNLDIQVGSTDYGPEGIIAKSVVTSPDDATLRYDNRGFYYGRTNDQSYLVAYTGNEHIVTLPSDLDGYQYVIGPYSFFNNKDIVSLDVGPNVTAIENNALSGCDNLSSLILGESVSRIENCGSLYRLFEIINLSEMNIEVGQLSYCGSVSYYSDVILSSREESTIIITDDGFVFGKPADEYCLICYLGDETNLVLPADINGNQYRLRTDALMELKLHSLDLGDGVTGADSGAFNGIQVETVRIGSSYRDPVYGDNIVRSSKLTTYLVDEENTMYSSIDGVLYSKDGTILAVYPGGKQDEEFTVPDEVTAVYHLGGNKFLKRVIMHDGIYTSTDTFSGCSSLVEVRLPSDLTDIPAGMFSNCTSLEHIDLPDTVTSIGNMAFYQSGIKEIDLPYGVTRIGNSAFFESELTRINIPCSVTTIGYEAFKGTKIESLFIPDSVTSLGSGAFDRCSNLHDIYIGNNVPSLYGYLASDYDYENEPYINRIYFGTGLTYIPADLFGGEDFDHGDYFKTVLAVYDYDGETPLELNVENVSGHYFVKGNDKTLVRQHTLFVNFKDGEETLYSVAYLEGDADIQIPDAPARRGYTASWEDIELDNDGCDVQLLMEPITYYVSFEPNGGSGTMETVQVTIEDSFNPVCTFTPPEHKVFSHWRSDGYIIQFPLSVDRNMTLTAEWEERLYSYSIRYVDETGAQIRDSLEGSAFFGTVIPCEAIWMPGYDAPSDGSLTVSDNEAENVCTLSYTRVPYSVTYVINGQTIYTDSHFMNDAVTVRDRYQLRGHTATDWSTEDIEVTDGQFTMPCGPVVFSSVLTVNQYQYTFTYHDKYGNQISEPVVGYADYGTEVNAYTDLPDYTLNGLSVITITDDPLQNVLDLVFNPDAFSLCYNVDNVTVSLEQVEHGTALTIIDWAPSEGYMVSEWATSDDVTVTDGTFTMPRHSVTFNATTQVITFQVRYFDYDGTLLLETTRDYWSSYGEYQPQRAGNAQYNYTFTGWLDSSGNPIDTSGYVRADSDLYASYSSTLLTYSVSYYIDDVYRGAEVYDYGTVVEVRPVESWQGYTITPWVTDDVDVKDGSFTITCNVRFDSSSSINSYSYTIYYLDTSQEQIAQLTVGIAEFSSTVEVEYPDIEGYVFIAGTESITISDNEENNYATGQYYQITHVVSYFVDSECVTSFTYGYGETVTVMDRYVKTGYTVTDWVTDDVAVENGSFVIMNEDVVFTATSSVNTYLCRINHVAATGQMLRTVEVTGTYGQLVEAPQLSFEGYYCTDQIREIEVTAEEELNQITYTYQLYSYTVNYIFGNDNILIEAHYFNDDVSVIDLPEAPEGYSVSPWEATGLTITDGHFTMPSHSVDLHSTLVPLEYPYTIRFVNQHDVEFRDPLTGTAKYGEYQFFELPEIDGYLKTEDNLGFIVSTENEYTAHYTVNTYPINYYVDKELVWTDVFEFGTVQELHTHSIEGHTLSPWVSEQVVPEEGRFTVPSLEVTFECTSSVNSYGYTITLFDIQTSETLDTICGTAEWDTVVNLEPPVVEGYTVEQSYIPISFQIYEGDNNHIVGYTVNYHSVIYYLDGVQYGCEWYSYGAEIPLYALPDGPGYTYDGWNSSDVIVNDGHFSMPDKDVVFSCTSTISTHSVRYYVDGQLVGDPEVYEYGTEVNVRSHYIKNGYTVTEWSTQDIVLTGSSFVMAESDIRFDAVSSIIHYTVTFIDDSAAPVEIQYTIENMADFSAPSPLARDHYTVVWSEYSLNLQDITVNAVYTPITYTVTFIDDSAQPRHVQYTAENLNSFSEPVPVARQYHEATWAPYLLNYENISVSAVYTPIVYTVTFIDDSAQPRQITYTAATINSFSEPVPAAREHYTVSWPTYSLDYENKTVSAVYTPIVYTVTFIDDSAQPRHVQYTAENLNSFSEPIPTPRAHHSVSWAAYTLNYENKTVNAVYVPDAVYTVKFIDWDDSEISVCTVYSGTMPVVPSNPVREWDGSQAYRFTGWDSEIVPATENKVYRAQYQAVEISSLWIGEDRYMISMHDCTDDGAYLGSLIPKMIKDVFDCEDVQSIVLIHGYNVNSIDFDSIYAFDVKQSGTSTVNSSVELIDWIEGNMNVDLMPSMAFSSKLFDRYAGDFSELYTALGHESVADIQSMTADISFTGVAHYTVNDLIDTSRGKVVNDGEYVYKYLLMDTQTRCITKVEAEATLHLLFKDGTSADVVVSISKYLADDKSGMDMEISYYDNECNIEGTVSFNGISVQFSKTFKESNPGSDIRGEYGYTTGTPSGVVDIILSTAPEGTEADNLTQSEFDYLKIETGVVEVSYTVKFVDGDDVKATVSVRHGKTVPEESVPDLLRENTLKYTYSNGKWDGFTPSMQIRGDMTFNAVYDVAVNQYAVQFFREQGDTQPFFSQTDDYGVAVRLPSSIPEKDGFVFREWAGFEPGPIVGDASYYAVFVEGQSTTNSDGSVTTVIEDEGTTITTNYATDGSSSVVERSSEQKQEAGKTIKQDVMKETAVDAYGEVSSVTQTTETRENSDTETFAMTETTVTNKGIVSTDSVISISSKDSDISTSATISAGADATASVAETIIGTQAATLGEVTVTDSAVETAISQLERVQTEAGETSVEKIIIVKATGDTKENASATITAGALKNIGDGNARFSLKADVGTIVIDKDVAGALTANASAETGVQFSIANVDRAQLNEAQQKAVGDHTVISLTASVGTSAVHQLGGKAKITVPYQLKAGEDASKVTVFFIDDEGKAHGMPAAYDSVTGTVTFETDHFSFYAIAQNTDFSDSGDIGKKDNTMLFAIGGVAAAIVLVGVFLFIRRR